MQYLPEGWVKVKLGEITAIKYGKGLPVSQLIDSGFPVFGANGVIGYHDKFSYEDEQLLISCRGANSGTINFSPKKCFITNNSLIVDFIVEPKQLRKTLFYFLQSANKERLVTGTAQPQVTINNAVELELSLPPLAEQRRIVAKIEELFSELDKGIENLKTARAQLKVYRQALLKHAFEGKLTADWREQNKDKLETSAALQQRIQTERTASYHEQLTDWQAAAQTDSKPKTPKPLSPLTNEELAKLPYGWITINVESLFNIEDGDRGENYPTKNDFSDTGHCLFLNAKNVTKRGFAFEEMSFITGEKDNQLRKGKLKRGDIVFTSRGTLGNIAHYNETVKHEHIRINSGMFIIRDYDISLTPDFLYYHLNAPIITSQIEKLQTGTAQPQLPIREFKSFRFVIPGKEEQLQIVQELETKLSEIDQLNQSITTSLLQSQALRQSILKKAFSGTLVAQDANDEPASVLLARIKTEKAVLAPTQQLKPLKMKRSLKVKP